MNKDVIVQMLERIRPDIDFEKEEALLSGDILDSLDFIKILAAISEQCGLIIDPMEITPENFDSADRIAYMIENHK